MARLVRRGDRVLLDQRVRIEREVRVPDGGGGASVEWVELVTVWARVEPLTGRERDHAQQAQHPADYRVTMRYRTDVRESDRLIWDGLPPANDGQSPQGAPRPMAVRFIARPSARSLYMQIDCQAGVETG